MTVINKLSSASGRRDEEPNIRLALEIIDAVDEQAVRELVDNLSAKNKSIQNDCIKVLYEVGEKEPILIAGHIDEFINLLNSKNNRLQWGAMTALGCITRVKPEEIFEQLPRIMDAADKGSVITRDNAVAVLLNLIPFIEYSETSFTLLIEQLLKCPTNQLPMYAERAVAVIPINRREKFVNTLQDRLDDIEKESKRKRVEKVIMKLS